MIKIADMTFYNVEELAEMLNLDPQTVRAYCRRGELKGRKVGVQWHVSAANVKAFLNEVEAPQAPDPAAE